MACYYLDTSLILYPLSLSIGRRRIHAVKDTVKDAVEDVVEPLSLLGREYRWDLLSPSRLAPY